MGYTVTFLESATGITRDYKDDSEWHDSSQFWWEEGNAACDCNRRWWFQDAANEERDEDPPCGDGGYRVLAIVSSDGRLLWSGD